MCDAVLRVKTHKIPNPVAINPASKRARLNSIAIPPSPMVMGVMGVSLAGVVLPPRK
jgi:hypothetical protein